MRRLTILSFRSSPAIALMIAAALPTGAIAAIQQYETPCTTKSECDYRADVREMRIRQQDWAANVKRADDFAAQSAQLRATARAEASQGRASRAQDIMRRRHAAAAGD